jgi:hypothetical protein
LVHADKETKPRFHREFTFGDCAAVKPDFAHDLPVTILASR